MNAPSEKVPEFRETTISSIMAYLKNADTTISPEQAAIMNIWRRDDDEVDIQDDWVITERVRARLDYATDDEIQKIYQFLRVRYKVQLVTDEDLFPLTEIKMELATNLDKSIEQLLVALEVVFPQKLTEEVKNRVLNATLYSSNTLQ